MIGWASSAFKILRGTTTNETCDEADEPDIIARRIPIGLRAIRSEGQPNVSGTPRTVKRYRGRCGGSVDLRSFDRIVDERTGTVFLVEQVSESPNTVGRTGLKFEAHRLG